MVKDGSDNHEVHYHDIGDYLTREDKLNILRDNESILNIDWQTIVPDKNNDWINQRDENYELYDSMYDKNDIGKSIYLDQLTGVNSARDFWVSGFSKINTIDNSKRLVENYSKELERLNNVVDPKDRLAKVNKNEDFISWTRGLSQKFSAGKHLK